MDTSPKRTVWTRIHAVSTWILIAYFGLMAIIHVVLTVLFYLGVWDTGVGYFLDFHWPAWVVALLDGTAAYLVWLGYRGRSISPLLGLLLTVAASAIMIGRALWFVLIPVLVVITMAGSIERFARSRKPRVTTHA